VVIGQAGNEHAVGPRGDVDPSPVLRLVEVAVASQWVSVRALTNRSGTRFLITVRSVA
jgi:hypothetical protein